MAFGVGGAGIAIHSKGKGCRQEPSNLFHDFRLPPPTTTKTPERETPKSKAKARKEWKTPTPPPHRADLLQKNF